MEKKSENKNNRYSLKHPELLNSMMDGFVFVDMNGIILDSNKAYREMLRYTEEELKRLTYKDITPKKWHAAESKILEEQILPSGFSDVYEKEYRKKNGTIFPVELRTFLFKNEEGENEGMWAIVRDISKRMKIINAQKTSELNFINIAEQASDGIFIIVDGIIKYCNQALAIIGGYTIDEIIGTSFLNYVHPDLINIIADRHKRRMAGENIPTLYETQLRYKNGSFCDAEINASFIGYNGGEALMVMVRDITERRKAEISLQESEQKYRLLFERNQAGVYRTTLDGQWIECNDKFAQMLGYPSAEKLKIHPVKDVYFSLGDRKEFITKLQTNGYLENYETQLKLKNNKSISILENVILLPEQNNQPAMIQGTCVDITDRKRTEEALLDSEKKFKAIVEWSPIGIYQSTAAGNFITANMSLASMLGYGNIEELMKINIRDCYYNYHEREKLITDYDKGTMGNVASLEVYWKKKDGKPISVLLSTHAIRDDEGNMKYYEGFVLDITERKSLEVQLLRTQRLDSLGTLASGIAHDLNNVLSPILLSVEMLRRYSPDEKSQNILSTLTTNVIRGRDIIKQVLTFARGFKTEHDILQSKHIIKEILNIIHETFPKNISVTSDIASDLWIVKGDATQLHQVLMNLSLNARDAIQGNGTITISASNFIADQQFAKMQIQAHEGNYIKITVHDTGHGIPHDIMEKIFDPFFTTKEIGKGTGLGLSTSHAIVKEHGGFIDVNSETGKGSTFDIYIPAVENIGDKTVPNETVKLMPGKGEGVLIVDDEESILDIIKQTLELYGYHTFTAKDGIEGIAVYAQNRDKIDLVLIDMMMPVMDGIQMYNALRKFNDKIPVITMSGEKLDISSINTSLSGVSAHLQKPYTAEILIKTLREVLEK